ncbi:rod shape-determining protein [Candidatus Saccharibacteria bacterium]|nr:rod shape-determining protein [Candidatus Saccharibacteria bacterium]
MSIIQKLKTTAPEKTPEAEFQARDDVILALDIGTEFVKVLLAKQGKNNKLSVIGVGKARQRGANMYAGAIADIGAVTDVCEEALNEAEKMAKVRAKLAVVGIAGELIKGNTSTVHYRRKNGNKPLSEAEMNLIIRRVQEKAGEQARREVALETNNPDVEVRLINSAIVSLTIDGYKISNPIGFKGTDLTIQFYTAYAPLVHISAIEKVCAELSLDLLAVAVEPFAVCRACLGDNPDSSLSTIVMDIGGGTTDIAVVDDGGVEGTKMFSIGGRSFTHQIETTLGVDFDTAEDLKVNPEKADEKTAEKLAKAIEKNLIVWTSGVELALSDFPMLDVLPNKVLLCGGGAGLMELQEELATADWYKNLPFARRPVIHLVEATDIPGIKNETEATLDHSFITAFGLLRVALDTLDGNPEGQTFREKLSKLLEN